MCIRDSPEVVQHQRNQSKSSRNKSLNNGKGNATRTVELTDSILKETSSSTQKKRKKFAEIQNNISNRIIVTFDNSQRHYYVPNTEGLSERNEFLYQAARGKDREESAATHKPQINQISRELAKSRREDYSSDTKDQEDSKYQMSNDNIIKTIGIKLEAAIKQAAKTLRGKLTYHEFCMLLKRLKNKVTVEKIVVDRLWNFMQPAKNVIDHANVYDVLIILLSTCSLDHEATYSLLHEYFSKVGIAVENTGTRY
eukprot:TRINITY_DN17092_c0_g1_i16.p1 TRINITY_DN17092_c0_g1~~TRINITY_DN17092_c0_g1_i16.p1  ORF type:complete len:269 (-),score=29.95 TRINITY_DN17092_c0_g1_i16:864-1625(-)